MIKLYRWNRMEMLNSAKWYLANWLVACGPGLNGNIRFAGVSYDQFKLTNIPKHGRYQPKFCTEVSRPCGFGFLEIKVLP